MECSICFIPSLVPPLNNHPLRPQPSLHSGLHVGPMWLFVDVSSFFGGNLFRPTYAGHCSRSNRCEKRSNVCDTSIQAVFGKCYIAPLKAFKLFRRLASRLLLYVARFRSIGSDRRRNHSTCHFSSFGAEPNIGMVRTETAAQ